MSTAFAVQAHYIASPVFRDGLVDPIARDINACQRKMIERKLPRNIRGAS